MIYPYYFIDRALQVEIHNTLEDYLIQHAN